MWPARTICSALEDMRNCFKTYNFHAIGSLIEEVQMLANRMEARLDTKSTYNKLRDNLRETKIELDNLKKEVKLYEEIKQIGDKK